MDERMYDDSEDFGRRSDKDPNDVNTLIDDLEELVEIYPLPIIRRHRPFRKIFFLDIDDVLLCTKKIRARLPLQIQKANEIVRDKDLIIEEANDSADKLIREASAQAEAILNKARASAELLVAADTITKQATAEGQILIKQAITEGEEIRSGAMEYAQGLLGDLNKSIIKLRDQLDTVQQAVEKAQQEISS